MMHDDLMILLERLASGTSRSGDLERARALVRGDDRLPIELRDGVLVDDVREDASALLAVLGEPVLPEGAHGLFAAEVDVADAVLAAIGAAEAPPVADAVRDEAGVAPDVDVPDGWGAIADALRAGLRAEAFGVDVSGAVGSAVGEAEVPVAAAVRAEAGDVDVARAVAGALGFHPLPLGAAVRAEAGAVDVAEAVGLATDPAWLSGLLDGELTGDARRLAVSRLRGDPAAGRRMTAFATLGTQLREALAEEAGGVDVWAEVAPGIGLADPEGVPGWDGEAFASAVRAEAGDAAVADRVMARVRRSAVIPGPVAIPAAANDTGSRWWLQLLAVVAAAVLVAVLVYRPGTNGVGEPQDIQFAAAGEVTIENLSYADDVMVHVIQAEGDAPLILWVEEEVTL